MLMARRGRRPCMEDSGPELHVCRRRSVVLPRDSGGIARHLVVSTLMGVGFCRLRQISTANHAAMISGAMLYGLLWRIFGPLILQPLLMAIGQWGAYGGSKWRR